MHQANYTIIPLGYPHVLRNCAKCGVKRAFLPSDQFRINAQKKLLDIWLIYQCERCGNTWNMELFARVAPKALPRAVYDSLLSNDPDLIREVAFDAQRHRQVGAPLCYEDLAYRIECGQGIVPEGGETELTLTCPVALGVRLHKLLRDVLGVSGKQFEQMVQQGRIISADGVNLMKARMGKRCKVVLRM